MNSVVYFEIQATDTTRAIQFYEGIFGWKFTPQPGTPVPYWSIATEGINGGLLERPAAVPPPQSSTNTYTCSMEVASFDAVAEKIISAGGQVALPKFLIPGKCWQGYFLDTEGNAFGLFQVV